MSPRRPAFSGLNLASRPFVNQRPVIRVSLLLAVAGALLLVLNLFLYVGYARTRTATASELRRIEARIDSEEAAVQRAADALAAADVEQQNELVTFLNDRIAERTFGWSVLFDRLAALLPGDVRLLSLAPRFVAGDEEQAATAADRSLQQEVALRIQGEAKDGEEILTLVDALFADPAFRRPDLSSETVTQGNRVRFDLTVLYLPEEAEARADRAAQNGDQGGTAAADAADGAGAGAAGEDPS